jgi:hypothetical protein
VCAFIECYDGVQLVPCSESQKNSLRVRLDLTPQQFSMIAMAGI